MTGAKTLDDMSPGLLRVMERARRDPHERQFSLAYLIDVEALRRAHGRIRKNAAVGVDGVTKKQYGQDLEANLADLHKRLRAMKYRHQPIRRVHIPKYKGRTRPIGISCLEDKIVQGALTEILGAIYEQDFLEGSYGFRPRRSPHDALRALFRAVREGGANVIFEADVTSFFDTVHRRTMLEMLEKRIADKSFMRLVGKCLHVGVLEGQVFTRPDEGTVQGSIISPMLGNIYLHNVFIKLNDLPHRFDFFEAVTCVVTEYGVANLSGRTVRERAQALIDIAHPDDRYRLVEEAKAQRILYSDQIFFASSGHLYPYQIRSVRVLKNNLEVVFRPIKPSDEEDMRRLFYRFSDESIYSRYFHTIKSMPHTKMQAYVNVDWSQEMSIVGLAEVRGRPQIIAEARYEKIPADGYAEIVFVVDEEFQGLGIATYLYKMLYR